MPSEVKLQPNTPLQLSLADPSGVPEDFRVHYALSDGHVLTLPRQAAIELNRLDLRPGEMFCICRDTKERKGVPESTYRVWLPPVTEQERAAEEAEAEPTAILQPYEVEYQSINRSKRRKPAKSDGEPLLFDRGTGTYGPIPQQVPIPEALTAQVRASGPIPMDVAFREVVGFVTSELKQAGEQWTDQAKQDIVSTVLIAAAKKGWVRLWERP